MEQIAWTWLCGANAGAAVYYVMTRRPLFAAGATGVAVVLALLLLRSLH